MFRTSDYLSELLIEGPPAARCALVRSLPADDFGPRVLAKRRSDEQPIVVRGMAIADAAWARTRHRLEAIAGVQGEHVAPLVAYGRHEGLAYFVHEHDGGPRLTSFLEEHGGRLPLPELLPVFAQLLVAVGEAHRQGVVVGGVRPQDVRVVASQGGTLRIRLLDLGFASVLGVPAGRRGAVDHPAIYRAPEADVAAHPASDVFSLGVLFVRMLTGPLPRSASEPERAALLRDRLAQAHRDDPGFSDGLFTLLSEVIDSDLATRPRNAQHLLDALLEVVPASTLRLPSPAASRSQPAMAEDGAPCWPARQWTVRHSWAEPRRRTPAPPRVAAAASSVAVPVLARAPAPAPRRRGLVSRVALAAAFLSTGTALGLAIAVAEPGATAAPAPAASLSAVAKAPAAVPASSTLVIETTPPGVLTVDGQRLGPTPYHGVLPAGAHVVRVEAPGQRAWRARLELAPGQARHVVVALEPATGPAELAHAGVVPPARP
jgi:hypothetical protein